MVSEGPKLSVAILGTRGVPPRYGGFETFAAELGKRLVARGHRVTVYCRAALYPDAPREWEGIRRVDLPAFGHKYLETVTHTLVSGLHAMSEAYDVALVCNAANAFVLPLLRSARIPVAINVDGIERKRKKWNALGRMVYHAGEALSVSRSDALVADASVIADYYRTEFGCQARVIPYGCEFPEESESDILRRLEILPRRYLLYVSRFEPENNALEVVEAYGRIRAELPLVMVGDAPYAKDYIARVRSAADERVLFPGAVYGIDYRTLQRNALLYIQATEIGGTHPALIEAMASGGAVLANGTPENREVGGDAVRYFSLGEGETLSALLRELLSRPGDIENLRPPARRRALHLYGWEGVTDRYEKLFRELR
ncbi:MAG: glycosyltransferase [Thermoanaerobaculia bacterium]